jgi:acetylornithine deacetylase/succinyl-diaminopimelate desuccinylase-like protein
MSTSDPYSYLADRQSESLSELTELLSIPSLSALPEHEPDVRRAAEWCAHRLTAAGLEHAAVMPTGGHPIVYADWLHAPNRPTVLVYGHFDVQPADPLALWTTPPFTPEIRDGRLYARGASDMKGNLMVSVLAVEAWLKTSGKLPVNIKYFLEGQEEIGSPQLPVFVAEHRDLLACELVISGDGLQWSETEPVLWISLRGGCGVEVLVEGAATDLHSGLFGGAAPNAAQALVAILDSMHAPDGSVAVEGFYDRVVPLTGDQRAQMAQIPFDEEAQMRALVVDALPGETGYSPRERMWVRPTLEINGLWGGFQGAGVKTVIPHETHAKITCRLVPDQDPREIADLVARHAERSAPAGVKVTATTQSFAAKPYAIPTDHWANRVAAGVLTEIYGRPPYYGRIGGSVPVAEIFLTDLGAYTVAFGFGQDDERIHAPDEFLRLANFERGQRAWTMLLDRLGANA